MRAHGGLRLACAGARARRGRPPAAVAECGATVCAYCRGVRVRCVARARAPPPRRARRFLLPPAASGGARRARGGGVEGGGWLLVSASSSSSGAPAQTWCDCIEMSGGLVTRFRGLVIVALALAAQAAAHPEFLRRIPNGDAHGKEGTGITCRYLGHENCFPGAERNPFGLDFKEAGLRWTKELCEKDSDDDGVSNGEELGDPCCLWSESDPTEVRLNMLSHPGVAEEDGAKNAPRCRAETEQLPSPSPSAKPSSSPSQLAATTPTPATTTPSETPTVTAAATETETASPTGSAPIASPQDDDDNVCFPAHSLVELQDGSLLRMDQIAVGDMLLVGDHEYSPVFMFTHQQQGVQYTFISLRTEHVEQSLMLTAGHYLYANGLCVPAAVKRGDWLYLADGSTTRVLEVSVRIAHGLYNPQTLQGDLVVNGIRVTTYTKSVEKITAHSLLAPLRALYQLCTFCTPLFEYVPGELRSVLL
ncbi:hypothetical protein FGB62_22g469 [Gracilaria domingensis]|nr:hypothetical protein FGB62_22g469 [Gracilaria domingensis]